MFLKIICQIWEFLVNHQMMLVDIFVGNNTNYFALVKYMKHMYKFLSATHCQYVVLSNCKESLESMVWKSCRHLQFFGISNYEVIPITRPVTSIHFSTETWRECPCNIFKKPVPFQAILGYLFPSLNDR